MTCLIVTGMHRSGTSFFSRLLTLAGWNLGENVIGPTKTNPHGHFEDIEFVKFHERILAHNYSNYLEVKNNLDIPIEFEDEAFKMIHSRENMERWGWKDPRSALFLEFWSKIIPEAHILIILRHPIEIINSLLKRELKNTARYKRLLFNRRAFSQKASKACRIYFEAFVKFHQKSDHSTMVCMESLIADPRKTIQKLNDLLDLNLQEKHFQLAFDPNLFDSSKKIKYLDKIQIEELNDLYAKCLEWVI